MPDNPSNELVILEFQIDCALPDGKISRGYYGINVSKVKRIINMPEDVVQIPRTHPAITGIISIDDTTIPLIDLTKWLKRELPDRQPSKIIITEFSGVLNGFVVHSVSRIHNILWKDVEHAPELLEYEKANITGIVKVQEKVILLLDFEKIVWDINPDAGFKIDDSNQYAKPDRLDKCIMVVEDSSFIRDLLQGRLTKAGYKVISVSDGQEAIHKLDAFLVDAKATGQEIAKFVNLVITDLEMPQMGGEDLIKKIKEDIYLNKLPVVVFSSLIYEKNEQRVKELGADAVITKPEIKRLVDIIDNMLLSH